MTNKNWQKFCDYNDIVNENKRNLAFSLKNNNIYNKLYDEFMSINLPQINKNRADIDLDSIRRNVLEKTKAFFSDVNLSIQYLDYERVHDIDGESCLEIHQKRLDESKVIDVFSLPIKSTSAYSSSVHFYRNNMVNFEDVIFEEIRLSNDKDSDIVESSYLHEIGHTFVERKPSIYLNHLMGEYVSFCLEMFYSYFTSHINPQSYKKLVIERIKIRQLHKKYFYMVSDYRELRYLVSYLLAIMTLEKYLDFSPLERQIMEADFKELLNNKITIEEFQSRYDINFNSEECIKLLKRTAERINS